MTAQELYERLLQYAPVRKNPTCDGILAGDPQHPVNKIAVCFKATAQVIEDAIAGGADVLITHEPVFYREETQPEPTDSVSRIELKKWKLLDDSGLVLIRFHDHAHLAQPDFIHEGFLQTMGWQVRERHMPDFMGIARYTLAQPMEAADMLRQVAGKLGLPHAQLVGDPHCTVRTVCLGLGSVGLEHIQIITEKDAELFITGELGELSACEYIRDVNHFGQSKALFLLGHWGSEYAGMRYLAQVLNRDVLSGFYLDSGSVFSYPADNA